MRPFKSLISWEEGKKLLLSCIRPVEDTEKITLLKAYKRVLAENIIASMNVPPFTRAAMDGYAVKATDTYQAKNLNPVKLKLKGSVFTGQPSRIFIKEGECVKVATGAPLPEGTDAVVMVEDTEEERNWVKIYKPVHPGENVSPAGEDIKEGQKVLSRGDFLTPARIGVLAALGKNQVEVFIKPRVMIISSGEEILSPGKPLEEGKIYDVNSYTLFSLVEENGGRAILGSNLKDDVESVIQGIKNALSEDLIVITGGSSAGEKDVIKEAVTKMGKLLFHGLAVKPGKPTLAAIIRGKLVIGMPGYPTSCLTNAYALLIPLLRKLAHLPPKREVIAKVSLSRRITSTLGRHQFLPVKLKNGEAIPVFKESGAITSMSEAHGYIEIPANVDLLEKGDVVEVKLFY